MYRVSAIVIGVLFLIYGLLRLGVGGAMLGDELGFFHIEPLQEALQDVGAFLEKKKELQIIPVSVAGYVAYIALMGLTLTTGAIGSLTNRVFGLPFIGGFLLMYVALFANFQTINKKIRKYFAKT